MLRGQTQRRFVRIGFAFALLAACDSEEGPGLPPMPTQTTPAQPVQAGDAAQQPPLPSTEAGLPAPAAGDAQIARDASAPAPGQPDAAVGTATHDHCVDGEHVDGRDGMLSGAPDQWKASTGAIDLVLPADVLSWMSERVWTQSHDAWHNVRRCKMGGLVPGGAKSPLCSNAALVATNAECSNAEDGYQFLVMHRHMMLALRQAFPQHTQLFAGFPKFPFEAKDVPQEWQGRFGSWAASVRDTATQLESVESKLSQFATEGDLGKFIQCGAMSTGASSIHGALHFKWVVNESPHSLGKQTVNIENYMFWKLHGWIDQIWERYRVAKGLKPDEPKLKQALLDQCREMQRLGQAIKPGSSVPTQPLPTEHGVFHEQVRPILERVCSGCHSESSPEANLPLGGKISSADVVKGLVNVQTAHGGQFMRVVPGMPDQSWLYLKISGQAASAGCRGAMCSTQVMPPAGQVTLSSSELELVRKWIADGASPPTP
jgi:hypothetical protein